MFSPVFRALVKKAIVPVMLLWSVSAPVNAEAVGDLVQTVRADGRFTVLLKAVETAGLLQALQSEGPFTLFAPTDDAFAALPEGAMDELLDPNNRALLTRVLKYHVVPEAITVSDLEEETFAETLEGNEVSIDLLDQMYVENAVITKPDTEAANGIIHVIDAVIVPSDLVL
ncbi:MAG: fasciclin domain-containing protein [Pseudomonadota bacterium]